MCLEASGYAGEKIILAFRREMRGHCVKVCKPVLRVLQSAGKMGHTPKKYIFFEFFLLDEFPVRRGLDRILRPKI
jgi:hypothetical protein